MKKQYTKKQITEAIKHWKSILKQMNESSVVDGINVDIKFDASKPDIISLWSLDEYGFNIKQSTDFLDILRQWKKEIEKYYLQNDFDVKVVSMEGPIHYDNEFNVGIICGPNCDKEAVEAFLVDIDSVIV